MSSNNSKLYIEITDCIAQILCNSDIFITAKKRQQHLSLTKQATAGLANERQSDIKNPLGRPQIAVASTFRQLSLVRSLLYFHFWFASFASSNWSTDISMA